ncbi:prepilin peptidase [Solimonas sp. K1W22B-7]|uniref:prepilin peptidase n=1 Tax=Solimonas sp. K1W22B-7 TaxID=2303331 RepID=UPI000E337C2A|nr:A24 family peptidase [Solimonas sp. K1W22B-7]AXQ30771.1 prepilin peptidase [Solimonas sp. K1W22B-7]
MIVTLVLGTWALAIGVYDLVRHRIPNLALLPVLVVAVLALAVNGRGLLGVTPASSAAGFALALALYLPGYALGKMGAGDVKFAACLGLLLGWVHAAEMLLIAGVGVGVISMVWIKFFGGDRKSRAPNGAAFAVAFCAELAGGPFLSVLEKWL